VKHFIRNLYREDGSSAIIVAFLITGILTMASLTIDIGLAHTEASKIQNIADAVVLSLGSYLPLEENDTAGKALVISKAGEYALKNGYENFSPDEISFGEPEGGRYMSLSVRLQKTSETYLAKLVGMDSITVSKSAQVNVVPAGALKGCIPIGITKSSYTEAAESGIMEHIVFKEGGGGGVNGFFGFIVIDGSNGNSAALLNTLQYGYPGEVCSGDTFPAATGNKASVAKTGVEYRMSLCRHFPESGGCTVDHYVEDCPRVAYVLLYDFVNTRTVRVEGFAAIILEQSESADEIQGSFISMNVPYTPYTADTDTGIYTYKLSK